MYKQPKAVYRRLFYWAVKGSAIAGFSSSLLLFLSLIAKTSSSRNGLSVVSAFSENDVFNLLAVLALIIVVPAGAIVGGLMKLSSLNLPRRKKAVK
ncbi:hypothetical protein [Acaryochloris thomasi]|nr:hypothetical protein [Acaryochloris thomasi]